MYDVDCHPLTFHLDESAGCETHDDLLTRVQALVRTRDIVEDQCEGVVEPHLGVLQVHIGEESVAPDHLRAPEDVLVPGYGVRVVPEEHHEGPVVADVSAAQLAGLVQLKHRIHKKDFCVEEISREKNV